MQAAVLTDPDPSGPHQLQQGQKGRDVGAAAFLIVKQFGNTVQSTFQQTTQHMDDSSGNRNKRCRNKRFKTFLVRFSPAGAAAHQTEPGLDQKARLMTAGVFGRTGQRHGLADCRKEVPRPAAKLCSNLFAGTVFDETACQFGLHAFRFGTAGQKQGAFHLDQMSRHINKFAGYIHPVPLHSCNGRGVLLDQLHDIDVIEVHFIL